MAWRTLDYTPDGRSSIKEYQLSYDESDKKFKIKVHLPYSNREFGILSRILTEVSTRILKINQPGAYSGAMFMLG